MIAKYNITLACLLGVISPNVMSETVDLDFSNHQEATDGTDGQLGPSYSGADMHFINVGTHDGKTIDAKVSSNTFGDATFYFTLQITSRQLRPSPTVISAFYTQSIPLVQQVSSINLNSSMALELERNIFCPLRDS